jgi:hypothetical protein
VYVNAAGFGAAAGALAVSAAGCTFAAGGTLVVSAVGCTLAAGGGGAATDPCVGTGAWLANAAPCGFCALLVCDAEPNMKLGSR